MSFIIGLSQLTPFFAASLIASIIAFFLLRREKSVPGRFYFGALMVGVAWWAFFNALEIGSDLLSMKIVFANCQYMAIVCVPVFFFRFALGYSGLESKGLFRFWWVRGTLWIIPAITAFLVWMDPYWGLVRKDFELNLNSGFIGFVTMKRNFGPWFFVHTAYSYTLLAITSVLWIQRALSKKDKRSLSGLLALVALFFPWIANFLYILGIKPWGNFDPTTLAFSVMGIVLLYTLRRYRFLSLLPVARETLMQNWGVPLFIFDEDGRLAFVNNEAKRRWRLNGIQIGMHRNEGIPNLGWLPAYAHQTDCRTLIDFSQIESRESYWEAEERPLFKAKTFRGSVLTLHDVTALTLSERTLQRLNSDLESRVLERTKAMEDANNRLSEELEYRRQTEHQLFYYSLHDPLTGLANRSLLLSRLGQTLERSKRGRDQHFGLIFLNFNGFKQVNDQFGNNGGDDFLRQMAKRLQKALRSVDTIARYRGDEFVILLDTVVDEKDFEDVGERLEDRVEEALEIGGKSLIPSARLGMVFCSAEYHDAEEIIRDAEIALRKSLSEGFNSRVIFRTQFREDAKDRLRLREDLGKAILNGELSLVFQPIVDLPTHRVKGWEALTRWKHVERGNISPGVFIPLAEESGTIYPLGLWVLRESARLFRKLEIEFPDRPRTFVAVNVSARQLVLPDFPDIVMGVLEREGLSFSQLSLEITENALIENSESVVPSLLKLRDSGINIKLDDFGTGYSSLQYLHRLPVDSLKIDRSFVSDLAKLGQTTTNGTADSIVRTIIRLAEELKINVIGEGVETEQQYRVLHDFGCHQGQGFLFSKGLTSEGILKFFSSWKDPDSPFPNGIS